MARLENNVEEEYIMVMKQNCYRERNYREYIPLSDLFVRAMEESHLNKNLFIIF